MTIDRPDAWTLAHPEWPPCPKCGRPVGAVTTEKDGTKTPICFTCSPRTTGAGEDEDYRYDREEDFHERDEEGR